MIKREISYTYWDDEAITTIKESIPYLGNIKHGLAKEFYRNGSIYAKRLYKFGELLEIIYFHRLSNGTILKSKDINHSEYVEEDGKVLLKEWAGRVDKKTLLSEAETKNGVLHGQKIVYRYCDGTISQILKYKDGKPEGLSRAFDNQGRITDKVNYKNGVRHGEAFLIGSSMFDEGALTQGVRVLSGKSINDKEFVALYENGNILELYFHRLGVKIARVHESMIKEVFFSTSLP